jgi:hypothetical protein
MEQVDAPADDLAPFKPLLLGLLRVPAVFEQRETNRVPAFRCLLGRNIKIRLIRPRVTAGPLVPSTVEKSWTGKDRPPSPKYRSQGFAYAR